jgi:hypothetical protein
MRIERVDMATPKPLPTPETMVEAVEWAGDFVTGLMSDWPEFSVRQRRRGRRASEHVSHHSGS